MLSDQGYDADWFRDALQAKGLTPCIPGRKSRTEPVRYDKRRYKSRSRIEIMFGGLKDYKDKQVLLTGGSGAMGRLIAADIRKQGGRVTVIDRVAPEDGGRFIQGDLSTSEGLEALVDKVAAEPWDILINLAGIQHFGPLEAQHPDHLQATYMVNLVAPTRLIHAVLPGMKARGSGQIANVGSIFGSINFAHFAT